MEASHEDRSARMNASSQDKRRHLKPSGSGRRRRQPSVEREGDARMDASSQVNRGHHMRRMDCSSAYSSSGGGGSHRRVKASSNSQQAALSNSSGDHLMGSSCSNYADKYKAAQKYQDEDRSSKSTLGVSSRRHTTRRGTIGDSSGTGDPSLAAGDQVRGRESRSRSGSRSPSSKTQKTRQLKEKYKLIGRAGGRRQSMDSAVTKESAATMDSQSSKNDASFKSNNLSPGRRRRTISPTTISNNNPPKAEKTLTATRLKNVFSSADTVSTKVAAASNPGRGVRRQTSLPIHGQNTTKAQSSRRMVERKSSGRGLRRRSSLRSHGSGADDSTSSGLGTRNARRSTRQGSKDKSTTAPWNHGIVDPSLLQAKADAQAMLDESMPSLAALDLSVHRVSCGSAFTTDSESLTPPQSATNNKLPGPLLKAASISLLVDNAQSHTRIAVDAHLAEMEDALAIGDAVGVSDATAEDASNLEEFPCSVMGDLSKSNQSTSRLGMTDISRSDGSHSCGMMDGTSTSMDDISRANCSNSQVRSSRRRRARSKEDGVSTPSRQRKQSPRDTGRRSRSHGANQKDRVASNHNPKEKSRSGSSDRRPTRRPSATGMGSRGNTTTKDNNNSNSGNFLQGSHTADAAVVPKKQKSSSSLQQSNAADLPKRQRSFNSLQLSQATDATPTAHKTSSAAHHSGVMEEPALTLSSAIESVHNASTVDASDPEDLLCSMRGELSKPNHNKNQLGMTDISRSDGSHSYGNAMMGASTSMDDTSRVDSTNSQVRSSCRRRARSKEDDVSTPSGQRKQSPRDAGRRSRSRGANQKDGVASNRNPKGKSRSGSCDRRPARRLSATEMGSRGNYLNKDRNEHDSNSNNHLQRRNTMDTSRTPKKQKSSSSLQQPNAMEVPKKQKSFTSLQRSQTMDTPAEVFKKQKSSTSLQRSQTAIDSPMPRRQKSVSSLKSAASKNSTGKQRKNKKAKSKSMLIRSLGFMETMWVRGSTEDEKQLHVEAAGKLNATLPQISSSAKDQSKGIRPNLKRRTWSSASIGTKSSESCSSRRSSGSFRIKEPPRRSMSSSSASTSLASSKGGVSENKRKERMSRSRSMKEVPEQRRSDATTWSLADIDLGDESPSKEESFSRAVTHQREEKIEQDTPNRKRNLRRTKSTGSSVGGMNQQKLFQKSLPKKVEVAKMPQDIPVLPTPKGKTEKDPFHHSTDQLDVLKFKTKSAKPVGTEKKNGKHGEDVNMSAPSNGQPQTHLYPFQVDAQDLDPFQSQELEEENEQPLAYPFATSLHDPFASKDPFQLMPKPAHLQEGHALGQPKRNDNLTNESTHSFHMTNEFGDFGHESFGSVNFNNSQDFAVVPAGEGTAKSLLG